MPRFRRTDWFAAEIGIRAGWSVAKRRAARALRPQRPTDILLCIADHFEPQHGRADRSLARARMDDWLHRYPRVAGRHRDADGRPPTHSFFYPWDLFDDWEFDRLVELCSDGWGEIEVHLHHSGDTEDSLRARVREALREFCRRGALSRWPSGEPAWGFIHGNWALNNSARGRWCDYCGVNNETAVLAEEGCYADFTFPSWQHTSQPRQVNSLFYASSRPDQPKGHDRGPELAVRGDARGDLLLVQGPLVPYLKPSGLGFRLGMDDGDLGATFRYSPERLDRWVRAGLRVRGCPERVFVKLHCHGAPDANRQALLGEDLEALFRDAETRYNDGHRFRLHYVTARELVNVLWATVAGESLSVDESRSYVLPGPGSSDLALPLATRAR